MLWLSLCLCNTSLLLNYWPSHFTVLLVNNVSHSEDVIVLRPACPRWKWVFVLREQTVCQRWSLSSSGGESLWSPVLMTRLDVFCSYSWGDWWWGGDTLSLFSFRGKAWKRDSAASVRCGWSCGLWLSALTSPVLHETLIVCGACSSHSAIGRNFFMGLIAVFFDQCALLARRNLLVLF